MNLSKLMLFLGLVFVFGACNNEDDDPTTVSLVGTWKATEVTCDDGVTTTTTTNPDAMFTANYTFFGKDFSTKVTFTEGPNTVTSSGSYTQVLTTDLGGGNSSTQDIEINDFLVSGTWERDGDMLTVDTTVEEPQTAEILELSSSTLRLKFIINTTETTPAGVITQNATVFYTFEKE